ncbi:hypothetical protein L2E82_51085 [Cichorium intybus]|nr:hypothetical protein L2E82_51085 [Cichorium intybus]
MLKLPLPLFQSQLEILASVCFLKACLTPLRRKSAGYVYLRFESVDAASRAQQAMRKRWFARRLISAIFLQPYEYDSSRPVQRHGANAS